MPRTPGNDITLGHLAGANTTLGFPRTLRDKHLYICGGTGTGKSKLLEHLIRQDIVAWRKGKCGMLVLDPHGSLYDSLLNWLAWHNIERPVVPIDLRTDEWIVSYNLLRQRKSADPAVLVDNITDAMAYVWGQDGTDETPLFARWAGNVVRALYEKKLTLVEAEHLINRVSKRMRQSLTGDLADQQARQDWQYVDTLTPKEFDAQIGSTVNRLQRFIRNQTMRAMFGQPDVSLDFGAALEDGAIILVNLATERARISKENADLFATLLLSDLWTAAQERGKRKGVKPFYLYLDEFQRFVTPTIAENLDEARGYGLHLTMAHQFPNQLLDRGPNGRRVYNSIMENASSKIVFRLSHEENLRIMAHWLFMGVLDPDEIKHELYSTKVMEYREEMRLIETTGRVSGRSKGLQSGSADGSGRGSTGFSEGDGSSSWTEFASESQSASDIYSESEAHSTSRVPMLLPVMGKELSHVQFRSLDEQLFRSMALLFDQRERHSVARVVGMSAPVSLVTPTVYPVPTSTARTIQYVAKCYEKLPFVVPGEQAHKQLAQRRDQLAAFSMDDADKAPVSAKRRIR